MVRIIVYLSLFVIFFISYFPITIVKAQTYDWWDTFWLYRKAINITNLNITQNITDYQILITLDTQTLISQGKMRSDCGDIRFVDTNNTLLNYWLESGCNTTSTIIWVKVPLIPGNTTDVGFGNGTTVIYVYYGNSEATSLSNGSNVFIFFDDAEVDYGNWELIQGKWHRESGLCAYQGSYGWAYSYGCLSGYNNSEDAVLQSKAFTLPSNTIIEFYTKGYTESCCDFLYFEISYDGGSTWSALWRNSSSWDWMYVRLSPSSSTNTKIRFRFYSDSSVSVAYSGAAFDDLRIREYISPEPTASIGAEETPNQPPIVYAPITLSQNYIERVRFVRDNLVVIRVNVTDNNGANDINKVLITVLDSNLVVRVNNDTMINISSITNGYTYEYNYTIPSDAVLGKWTIKIFANDTSNAWGSNSTVFEVFEIKIRQWVEFSWFNNTHVNLTLNVWVYNPTLITFNNLNISVSENYTNYTITILPPYSENLHSETKLWVRPVSTDVWFNFSSASITIDETTFTSNTIAFIIPVDPATKVAIIKQYNYTFWDYIYLGEEGGKTILSQKTLLDFLSFFQDSIKGTSFGRTISSDINYSEFISKLNTFQKSGSDKISYGEFVDKLGVFGRSLEEKINFSEIVEKLKLAEKNLSEKISYGELLEKLGLFDRKNVDMVKVYDLMYRLGYFGRSLDDKITYGELMEKIWKAFRFGGDSVSYYELLSRLSVLNKQANDEISIRELYTKLSEYFVRVSSEVSYNKGAGVSIEVVKVIGVVIEDAINILFSTLSWYTCQIGVSCPFSWITVQAIPVSGAPAYYSNLLNIISIGYKAYFETLPTEKYELPIELINLRNSLTKVQIYPIDERTWMLVDNKIILTKQNITAELYLLPNEKREVKLYLPAGEVGSNEYYFLVYAENGSDFGSEVIKIVGVVSEFSLANVVKVYVIRYSLLIIFVVIVLVLLFLFKRKIKINYKGGAV